MCLSGDPRLMAASVACWKKKDRAHASIAPAAFSSHRGFIYIDRNLIMILLVLFSLGIFRGLVTRKREKRAEENKLLREGGLCCASGAVSASESERPFMCASTFVFQWLVFI